MKLYIKQKVFSIKDKFNIYDENQNPVYTCDGKLFSIGKKLDIFDSNNELVSNIHQKVIAFLPKYFINKGGEDVACVKKQFAIKPTYNIDEFGWEVKGNFLAHTYTIKQGLTLVAEINKKWVSWGDTYEIDIKDGFNPVDVISVVLIIDSDLANSQNFSVSFGSNSN